jgi:hypothetical protein
MTHDRQQGKKASERRQYFRVKDSVRLEYQQVSREAFEQMVESRPQEVHDEFTVIGSMQAITQEMSGVLRKVESQMPDIARYLKSLDRKVDLLARALLNQDEDISRQTVKTVDLSASGISFDAPEPLQVGSLLELKLLLLPDYVGMLIYGEVVGCDPLPSDESGFCARVNFTHLREEDQDLLIRHVLQRQGEYLRRRRDRMSALKDD